MDVDYFNSDMAQEYVDNFNRKKCRHKPSEEVGAFSIYVLD